MAKPIKETPVLSYRFEMAAQNVAPLPQEEKDEIWRVYEEMKNHCTFSL